ncbi:MAG: hypothetical protein WC974_07680 [Thermoplasmata archaeon]
MQFFGKKLPRPMVVLFVAGFIILSIALAGLFVFEENEYSQNLITYHVTWNKTSGNVASRTGSTSQKETLNEKITVFQTNLTQLYFNITLNDKSKLSSINTAEINVKITAPNGSVAYDKKLTSGAAVSVKIPLSAMPNQNEIKATSEKDAINSLSDKYETTDGSGIWNTQISYKRTLDTRIYGPDDRIEYKIAVGFENYNATIKK